MPESEPSANSLYAISLFTTWFAKNTPLLPLFTKMLYAMRISSALSTKMQPPRCSAQSPPEGTSNGSMYVLRVWASVRP